MSLNAEMLSEYGGYPDFSGVKRALVICLRNIGDVVLSSPVFSVLKRAIPGVTVDALVNSGTGEVLLGNPDIDRIHVLNRDALNKGQVSRMGEEIRLLRAVRSREYHLTINLTPGDRGGYLGFLSGARIRVGANSSRKPLLWEKRFYTVHVHHASANRHYVERNLDCLRRIGIFPPDHLKGTTFFEGEAARSHVRKWLAEGGIADSIPYIVVHPTSRWLFKCWSYEKVAGLVDRIQGETSIPVVITSAPDSLEVAYINNVLSKARKVPVNLSAKLGLRELGALIRMARLFVGVDSAPMHIAAAVKTPVVGLFGPTSELDWGPWGEGHRVIHSSSHSCRPCNRDGCGGSKRSECLEQIDVNAVFEAVKESLLDNPCYEENQTGV